MSRLSVVEKTGDIAPAQIMNAAGEWVAYVRSPEEARAIVNANNLMPALVSITENAVEIIARLDALNPLPVAGTEFLATARTVLAMLRIETVPTGRLDA